MQFTIQGQVVSLWTTKVLTSPQHLDAQTFENTHAIQSDTDVECALSAECEQNAIWPLSAYRASAASFHELKGGEGTHFSNTHAT